MDFYASFFLSVGPLMKVRLNFEETKFALKLYLLGYTIYLAIIYRVFQKDHTKGYLNMVFNIELCVLNFS